MEAVGTIFGLGLAVAIAGFLLHAVFILIAARISGIKDSTYGGALCILFLGGVFSGALSLILGFAPSHGVLLSLVAGIVSAVVVTMFIFSTTFFRALGTTIIASFLTAFIIGGLFFLGGANVDFDVGSIMDKDRVKVERVVGVRSIDR